MSDFGGESVDNSRLFDFVKSTLSAFPQNPMTSSGYRGRNHEPSFSFFTMQITKGTETAFTMDNLIF
jgi:hypothetical protein